MKRFNYLVIILVVLAVATPMLAKDNPLLKNSTGHQTGKTQMNTGLLNNQSYFYPIIKFQRGINEKIMQEVQALKQGGSLGSLILISLMTFLFGAVHALTPGHGKIFTFFYVFSNKVRIRHTIILGFLVALFHTLTASVLILLFYIIVKQSFGLFLNDANRIVQLISYGLIALLGLWSIIRAVFHFHPHGHSHEHSHGPFHGFSHGFEEAASGEKPGNLASIALAIGMVPCTGTIAILLFTLSLSLISMGIYLVFLLGLGMGAAISLIGLVSLLSKKGISQLFVHKHQEQIGKISSLFEILGSVLFLLFGVLLFMANL